MKLLNGSGCQFPDSGGNEGYPATTDYDSRRTGNGSLDAGSTPAYSIKKAFFRSFSKGYESTKKDTRLMPSIFFVQVDTAFLQTFQHASRDNTHSVFYLPSFITSSMLRYTGCVNSSFN